MSVAKSSTVSVYLRMRVCVCVCVCEGVSTFKTIITHKRLDGEPITQQITPVNK